MTSVTNHISMRYLSYIYLIRDTMAPHVPTVQAIDTISPTTYCANPGPAIFCRPNLHVGPEKLFPC